MDFGIANVTAITALCYVVGLIVKATGLDNKWIPCIVGVFGAVLGGIALYCGMPDFPAKDYITALAVGVVSGLASTGINQVVKQLASEKEYK